MKLLMVTRGLGDDLEAEPVLVAVDGQAVVLTLDDGEVIAIDRADLLDAIAPAATARREAA